MLQKSNFVSLPSSSQDVKTPKKGRKSKGAAGDSSKKKTIWTCVFCSTEPFATNAALRKHQDEAHEGYHDKCDQCDLKFFKVADLQVHTHSPFSK